MLNNCVLKLSAMLGGVGPNKLPELGPGLKQGICGVGHGAHDPSVQSDFGRNRPA